ncbi:MAG: phage tail protein I [Ectothiorhodospiraceae bacterium]|nr:phage tail protein I [Ectothiorhodospiraceae bacterium]
MSSGLLPPNASRLQRDLEAATARQGTVPVEQLSRVWNPDTCPARLLPWLAWSVRVDRWNSSWSTSRKRQVIKAALRNNRHRGTVGALRRALAALGMDITIREWFDYDGEPYHFRLDIDLTDTELDQEIQNRIHDIVRQHSNARSVLEVVNFFQPVTGDLHLGVAVAGSDDLTIYPAE